MNLWGEKSGHKAEKEKEAWLHMVGTREIGGERGWEGRWVRMVLFVVVNKKEGLCM
jgi:hypothetical protein